MVIYINYDLIGKIKDYKEPLSPFKVIRHTFRNKRVLLLTIPLYFFVSYGLRHESIGKSLGCGILVYSFDFIPDISKQYLFNKQDSKGEDTPSEKDDKNQKKKKEDLFKEEADTQLRALCSELRCYGVDTDLEHVLGTEFEKANYKIRLTNENGRRLPQLVETKHILVPARNHFGDEIMVPLIQEHVLYSKKYVLKRGETRKQTVSVPVTSQI